MLQDGVATELAKKGKLFLRMLISSARANFCVCALEDMQTYIRTTGPDSVVFLKTKPKEDKVFYFPYKFRVLCFGKV